MAHRLAMLIVVALSAACGSGELDDISAAATTPPITVDAAVVVPEDDGTAAVFMTIGNEGSDLDRLARAEIAGCDTTELHETPTAGGAADMRTITEGIAIPPQAEVRLGPGALHVMCMGGASSWVDGDSVAVALDFEVAGRIEVTATVMAGG